MSSNKVRKKGHLICPPEFHAQSGYFLIPSLDSVFHCIGQPLLFFFLSFFLFRARLHRGWFSVLRA